MAEPNDPSDETPPKSKSIVWIAVGAVVLVALVWLFKQPLSDAVLGPAPPIPKPPPSTLPPLAVSSSWPAASASAQPVSSTRGFGEPMGPRVQIGPISGDIVPGESTRLQAAMERCFEEARRTTATEAGFVLISVDLGADGAVGATMSKPEGISAALVTCAVEEVKKLKYARAGGITNYPTKGVIPVRFIQ